MLAAAHRRAAVYSAGLDKWALDKWGLDKWALLALDAPRPFPKLAFSFCLQKASLFARQPQLK
jgi:hypothetical protein